MKTWVLTGLVFCGFASAHPGTYEGKGTFRKPGSLDASYDTKLVVKELSSQQSEVSETFTMSGKPAMTVVSLFQFNKDGSILITENKTVVGHGFCMPTGSKNMWCDFNRVSAMGTVHVNMYYDATGEVLHRMGELIDRRGGWTFVESLDKK
jgi:hypothetical protein